MFFIIQYVRRNQVKTFRNRFKTNKQKCSFSSYALVSNDFISSWMSLKKRVWWSILKVMLMQTPVRRPAKLTHQEVFLHLSWFSVGSFKVYFPEFVTLPFVRCDRKDGTFYCHLCFVVKISAGTSCCLFLTVLNNQDQVRVK